MGYEDIGLAANILAFIAAGWRVFTTGHNIHKAGTGVTSRDASLHSMASYMDKICTELDSRMSASANRGSLDATLQRQTLDYSAASERLRGLLASTKYPMDNSNCDSLLAGVEAWWNSKHKSDLEDNVRRCWEGMKDIVEAKARWVSSLKLGALSLSLSLFEQSSLTKGLF